MSQDKSKKDLQKFLKGVVKKAKQESKNNKELDADFVAQAALLDTTAAILNMGIKNIDNRIEVLQQCGKIDFSKLCSTGDNFKNSIYVTFLNCLLPSYAKTSYRELRQAANLESQEENKRNADENAEEHAKHILAAREIISKIENFDYVKKHFIEGVPLDDSGDAVPEGKTHRLRNIATHWTSSTMSAIWRFTARRVVYPDFENKESAAARLPRLLRVAERQFESAVKNGNLKMESMGSIMLSMDIASLLLCCYGWPRVDTKSFDNHNLRIHTARVVCGNISFDEMCRLACDTLRNIRKMMVDTQTLLPAAIERFHADGTAFKIGSENER